MKQLQQIRKKAAMEFERSGFPSNKEELWRFIDVSPVANAEFSGEWKPSDLNFEPLSGIVMVFENGRWNREKSKINHLPPGVCIGSVMDLVDLRFTTLANVQSGFVAANTARFSDGAFIELIDGVVMNEPIHLVYLSDADGAAFHFRNFVSCGEGSKVTVIEEYIGADHSVYWNNGVTEVFAAEDATVDHYKIQREGRNAFHFQTLEALVGERAEFRNHSFTQGAVLGRNDIRGRLSGEEGRAVFNGLYLLKDGQVNDTHLFMDHAVPHCDSHQLYKGILADKARGVFCGRIRVRQDAQHTNALQANNNLLLSRSARVNTLPQLEIYADDVACTHGATIGELDEEALYYLQTRGIDPTGAHAMLTTAFANEVLDGVSSVPVREKLENLALKWLKGVAQ